MSKRKKYRVGEIFRHNGETYLCVTDKTNIHFIRVTEPKEGMVFRASDRVLYELHELNEPCPRCENMNDNMSCSKIDSQAFGECFENNLHWFPVEEKQDEKKEVIDYSKIDLRKIYMKRHLELAVVAVENDIVKFKVADQFYFGDEFSKQEIKSEFKAKNRVTIRLEGKLEWDEYSDILIIRRFWSLGNVNETTECNVHNFADIMEAVNEYNETNGEGYEKKFPEEGDNFYFITSKMTVSPGEFGSSMDGYEFKMRDAGNCFLTREEAEAALERVKKALKGE